MTANPTWSTACPDWGTRLVKRQSIIPPAIFASEAERALAIFKKLQIELSDWLQIGSTKTALVYGKPE